MVQLRRICVFCGSRPGAHPDYLRAATDLGTLLAHRGIEVVYGGAQVGLMGAVADAALAAGGRVTGVIPDVVVDLEVAHRRLTNLHVVRTMHERKMRMADLSDGFIALPGGFGTLDEIFETATWVQLGIHNKPLGFLNVRGYYRKLMGFLDHATEEGFLTTDLRRSARLADTGEALLDMLGQGVAAPADRPCIDPDRR